MLSSIKICTFTKKENMKKKEKLLISLLLFLVVLFFWTRQEIGRNRNLLNELSSKEVGIFETTIWNFNEEIKKEISPLMYFSSKEIIDSLTMSKCNLRQVTIVIKENGIKTVFPGWDNWERDIVFGLTEKGASAKTSNPQEAEEYYKQQMTEYYDNFCFSVWSLIFFFLKKLLISALIFILPLFLSLKLFLLLTVFLIVLIPLLSTNINLLEVKKEITKDYSFNKAPPIYSHCYSFMVIKEFVITPVPEISPLVSVKILFPRIFHEKVKKIINRIFHVPKMLFVLN